MYAAQYDGIMSLLAEIRDRLPAQAGATLDEPPIGSKVEDVDGHIWMRGEHGWGVNRPNGDSPWTRVQGYSPLTLIQPEVRTPRVINVVLPDEPEIGTKWRDKECDVWTHGLNGWGVGSDRGREPWNYVCKYVPLTEVIDE